MAAKAGLVVLGTLGTLVAATTQTNVLKEHKPRLISKVNAAALPWSRPNNHDNSQFLQGKWKNELGSVVELEQLEDGKIIGNYKTAVESKKGAAGDQPRRLYGSASLNCIENPTFGFTVVWKGSSTSWSGHFFREKGEDKLLTAWILTSKQDSIGDSWQAYRVGFDQFTRIK